MMASSYHAAALVRLYVAEQVVRAVLHRPAPQPLRRLTKTEAAEVRRHFDDLGLLNTAGMVEAL